MRRNGGSNPMRCGHPVGHGRPARCGRPTRRVHPMHCGQLWSMCGIASTQIGRGHGVRTGPAHGRPQARGLRIPQAPQRTMGTPAAGTAESVERTRRASTTHASNNAPKRRCVEHMHHKAAPLGPIIEIQWHVRRNATFSGSLSNACMGDGLGCRHPMGRGHPKRVRQRPPHTMRPSCTPPRCRHAMDCGPIARAAARHRTPPLPIGPCASARCRIVSPQGPAAQHTARACEGTPCSHRRLLEVLATGINSTKVFLIGWGGARNAEDGHDGTMTDGYDVPVRIVDAHGQNSSLAAPVP